MKKILFMIFIPVVVSLFLLYLYTRPEIALVEDIPIVFDKSQFNFKFINGGTWIYKDNEDVPVYPIAQDNKMTLYILNGAGEDFINYSIFEIYKIDKLKKEIVIIKNLVNLHSRDKVCFQVIEVPKKRYSKIVNNNKIRIRIKSGSAYQLIEYDLMEKSYKIIDNHPYAK